MADLVPMSQAATTSLVTTLQNTDLFALAREDNTSETGFRSKVSRVDALAKKVVNETDYSQLQTTNKKIIGAINEVNSKASQFDNMTATASGSIATFTDGGDDIPVSEYECEIVAQQASGTPTPDNPLPITGFSQADITVTDNDQITNLYTVAFGQTIYGGRLIYKNGQWSIEATHGYVDLGSLTWSYNSTRKYFESDNITNIKTPATSGTIPNFAISDIYVPQSSSHIYNNAEDYNYTFAIFGSEYLGISNQDYTDAPTFKTAMSGHCVVYELATPVIVPITSSTRVKTISGVNNIFSNTGDNTVKYFTEKADSLAELIKAFVL